MNFLTVVGKHDVIGDEKKFVFCLFVSAERFIRDKHFVTAVAKQAMVSVVSSNLSGTYL